jgi:RHS repeat-associated protein
MAVTATNLAVQRRKQTPFGQDRGTPPAGWPTERGFVGGTNDPTGLVHLGAREYDPAIGRFISVDPIQDLTDPQQWNGYAYAHNNPTTSSDPTGLIDSECAQVVGGCKAHVPGNEKANQAAKKNNPCYPIKCDQRLKGVPKKKETGPTNEEVIDDIVRRQTKGKVKSLKDLVRGICETVVEKYCAAVKEGADQFLREFGGKPFDCSLFPNKEQCATDIEGWLSYAAKHLAIGLGYCNGMCISAEFQGGVVEGVVGVGPTVGAGLSLTWNSLEATEKGVVSINICGAEYVGMCGGVAPKVDENGEWMGLGWSAGITGGMGQLEPALGYTIFSLNIVTGQRSGPQDPLPPSLKHRVCGMSRWC